MVLWLGLGLSVVAPSAWAQDAMSVPRHISIEDTNNSGKQSEPSSAAVLPPMPQNQSQHTAVNAPRHISIDDSNEPRADEGDKKNLPTTPMADGVQDKIAPPPNIDVGSKDNTAVVTTDNPDGNPVANDPYEKINRKIFALNDFADRKAVKPIARGYKKYIPPAIRRCAGNFFDNLGLPYTALNNVLQGKFKAAGQDVGRLLVNSTLGLGGCLDIATPLNIPKHNEDFGQTLGVWGVKQGAFVTLPFFGPSNVRDALARPIDFIANPVGYLRNVRWRNSLQGYKLVDARADVLDTTDILDDALDPYVMARDAWVQYREAQVRDQDGSYDQGDAHAPMAINPAAVKTAPISVENNDVGNNAGKTGVRTVSTPQ